MREQSIITEDAQPTGLSRRASGLAARLVAQLSLVVGCLILFGGAFNAAAVFSITSQPTNQTVIVGNSATFSVGTSGTVLGYQWYQNGSPIALAIGSSYTVLIAASTSAGSYTVVVTGLSSSITSSPAILTVNKAPAPLIFTNLSQTYNGSARAVTVNTAPIGLYVALTYNSSTSAPTNAGSYLVSATIIDLNYIGTATDTLIVGQAATTNTVTASLNPAAANASVVFTATLTPVVPGGGVPTGNVVFKDGATVLGTGALNGSATAIFSTTTLAHGNHTIRAEYAGDSNFTGSSNTCSELIDSAPVATTQTWQRTPGTVLKIRTATLLAGDTDADNDTLSLISTGTTGTNGGTVATSGGWIFYTPPIASTNADSFPYVIADSSGLQATGTVAVTVWVDTNAAPNIGGLSTTTNGAPMIQFNVIPGRTCTVQYCANQQVPAWQSLGTATADTSGKFNFTDNTATNSPTRFYRSIN